MQSFIWPEYGATLGNVVQHHAVMGEITVNMSKCKSKQ